MSVPVPGYHCGDRHGNVDIYDPVGQTPEIVRLQNLVSDLQSGMYINCVYCGHRYGPRETTAAVIPGATPTMAEALTAHIAACPKHPVKVLADQLAAMSAELDEAVKLLTGGTYECSYRDAQQNPEWCPGIAQSKGPCWEHRRRAFLARLDAKAGR